MMLHVTLRLIAKHLFTSKKIIKQAKYISTHLVLFRTIEQYLIILSTSFFQFYSLTLIVST